MPEQCANHSAEPQSRSTTSGPVAAGFGNLVAKHPPSPFKSPYLCLPLKGVQVLTNHILDPQDDQHNPPHSAFSRWETLDSKARTHEVQPCHVEHPAHVSDPMVEKVFSGLWECAKSVPARPRPGEMLW